MDDKRREPTAADIKAEREARYKRSLAYGIEKARASKARTQALKNAGKYDRLEKLYNAVNVLIAELVRSKHRNY